MSATQTPLGADTQLVSTRFIARQFDSTPRTVEKSLRAKGFRVVELSERNKATPQADYERLLNGGMERVAGTTEKVPA